METIIIGFIGLIISYFIIYMAIKDAIEKKLERYQCIQTGCLKYLAKQAGMTAEEIDKFGLTEKEFKKKYKERKLGDALH